MQNFCLRIAWVKIERSSSFNECSSKCHVKIDKTFFLGLFEVCLVFGRAKSFKLQFSIILVVDLCFANDVNTVLETVPVWPPVRYISDIGQYRCTVSGLPLFFVFIYIYVCMYVCICVYIYYNKYKSLP